MKNPTVKKINTLGTVAFVIDILVIIGLIAGIVGSLLAGVTFLSLPDNALDIKGNFSSVITVDESNFGSFAKSMFDSGHLELVNIPEENIDIKNAGFDMGYKVEKVEKTDNGYAYTINGEINQINGALFKASVGSSFFILALMCALLLIPAFFGKKLTKALSKCDSPFHEEVIKAMKHFAFSLIPFGVACLFTNGVGLLSVLAILIIILFIFVFSYGAQLQKESDETL
ncbi:MAG: hypothetical protein IJJ57_12690 [Ruminococcus sp.]|nr:hypothetical protein [Ruminococcus sp.]